MEPMQRSRSEPNAFARELFDGLPTRYDALAEVLSFGQNRRWRAALVDSVVNTPRGPGQVLDVATGTAGIALALATHTDATVTGIDLNEQMLRRGRQRVSERGQDGRIRLAVGRAEQLPFPDGSFDALTFSYLLRYVADPAATIRELARVVRPGGTIASLEFLVPSRSTWRLGWLAYTRLVLPVAGLITGGAEWFAVGRFLGPSISAHYRSYPVPWTVAAWRAAGVEQVTTRSMSLGGGLVMWGRKSGD